MKYSDAEAYVRKVGFRPFFPEDGPTLTKVPGHGPVKYQSVSHFMCGLGQIKSFDIECYNDYMYYLEMKPLAQPCLPRSPVPFSSRGAKFVEYLASIDNLIHGPAVMDHRVFMEMAHCQSEIGQKALNFFLHDAAQAQIPLEYFCLYRFISSSIGGFLLLKLIYEYAGKEAAPSLLRELVMDVPRLVAKDLQADTILDLAHRKKEWGCDQHIHKYMKAGENNLNHIVHFMFAHKCRPLAARAIFLDQEAESPMAQTVYGEDTSLTRHLVTKAALNRVIVPLDPIWWWNNQEIRSKVNYKYAPDGVSPESWGWLLRAGVPPIVLCEHKLTKAEATDFCLQHVPSWRHKLKPRHEEPDHDMYFRDDKDDAISGEDIFSFRFGPKIGEIQHKLGYPQSHTFFTAVTRGPIIVREWAINKHEWLLKEHTIHGPAGRAYTFQPISRLDEVRPEDLAGDVNASPEKVFERMGERVKKEIEQANLKGFAFPEWKHPLHPDIQYIGNSVALQHEGALMHHCCSSYSRQCERGETFVFHVGPPAPFGSTVEARYDADKAGPKKLTIFQHYGPHNSTPDEQDKKIVLEWSEMCTKRKKQNPPLRWRDVVLCPPMRG